MSLPAWREEPIARIHDREGFDCGDAALNSYLRQHARKSHEQGAAKTFLAPRWHVRSVEQTIIRAGEKMPKYTMPWIYQTKISITRSSLNRSLDHLEDPRSKEFGGSLQSSLLLRLSRSISMLLTECSTQEAQPIDK